jgi:hypothetical protein
MCLLGARRWHSSHPSKQGQIPSSELSKGFAEPELGPTVRDVELTFNLRRVVTAVVTANLFDCGRQDTCAIWPQKFYPRTRTRVHPMLDWRVAFVAP